MVADLREARQGDLDAFYEIALATGHDGADASHLHDDPKLVGHIYSAPYLKHAAELCFVAEDDLGVGGYIVGALDTVTFAHRLERDWWPDLRACYPEPDPAVRADWTADQRRAFMIHHPEPTPAAILEAHPAHLHMNLLPRFQGRGLGAALLERWLDVAAAQGAVGAHVGTGPRNPRALRFWRKSGFADLAGPLRLPPSRTVWLGRRL